MGSRLEKDVEAHTGVLIDESNMHRTDVASVALLVEILRVLTEIREGLPVPFVPVDQEDETEEEGAPRFTGRLRIQYGSGAVLMDISIEELLLKTFYRVGADVWDDLADVGGWRVLVKANRAESSEVDQAAAAPADENREQEWGGDPGVLGQKAYEAYVDSIPGSRLMVRQFCPPWEEIGHDTRCAWTAAAVAVRDQVLPF